MDKHLKAREIKLRSLKIQSRALFPPLRNKTVFIYYSSLAKLKANIEKYIREKFEHRSGRRTFGQRALDSGQDLHDTSIAMGHASVMTTQKYYADRKQTTAIHICSPTQKTVHRHIQKTM
jgi:integrase/recombinase XerD